MSLSPGTYLGPYAIVAAIGAGGMGEVYRARDSKLDRDVAIKVLPESFALDADRVARFTREAKTLASLNHPNIAQIYGIEDPSTSSGQATAIVMELVDGDDLAVLIARGPIALADALPIAKQIADALEAAHEQGIVHRDLKPANIKVKADGTVKVLDFGLAKALGPDGASATADAINSPTMTVRGTQMGMIIGTAAYMSPEQARGKTVDRRADIWAFGVVLYEMLTGRRAFDGEDISVTLANVIKEEPKWAALPGDVPSSIRRLLRRCLEKDPKKRLSAAGDARLELDELDTPAPAGNATAASRPTGWMAAAGIASVLAAGLAVFAFKQSRHPAAAGITTRVQIPISLPAGGLGLVPVVSPDGRHVAFSAGGSLEGGIWLRSLDAVEAHPLQGGADGAFPFWSPDSRSVGFFAGDDKLRRVDITGGAPLELADTGKWLIGGAAWGRDGTIVFGADHQLRRVPASGGKASVVALDDGAGDAADRAFPQFLSDGRRFLYAVRPAGKPNGQAEVRVGSLDQPATTVVADVTAPFAYATDGRLLFMRGTMLVAQRFDERRLQLVGEASPVASDAAPGTVNGLSQFSVSASGALAYTTTRLGNNGQLVWFDRSGKALGAVQQPPNQEFLNPSLSPDATQLAVNRVDTGGNWDVWIVDLKSGTTSRATSDPARDSDAVWSPDGHEIAFTSNRGDEWGIYRKSLRDGSAEQLVLKTAGEPRVTDWTRTGLLIYNLNADLLAVPTTGDARTPRTIAATPFYEDHGRVSPDGRWITFLTNETGDGDVYIQPFPGPGGKTLISHGYGHHPRWRADGRELIYWGRDQRLMAVDLTYDGAGVHAGTPRVVLPPEVTIVPLIDSRTHYDITPDAQRFLIRRPIGPAGPSMKVILNWAAGLRQ